jgi:NADH-quinone oxidoreductase subunit M
VNPLEGIALAGVATCVTAPAAGALALRFLGQRLAPRLTSGVAIGLSFGAAVVVACCWQYGGGRTLAFGSRMAGGDLVVVDGLTALLLPYVAAVDMAIVLVAPRRALATAGVHRLLVGASANLAMMSTSHPLVLVALWALTSLSTWLSIRGTLGGRATARTYAVAMVAAFICLAIGTFMLVADPPWLPGSGTRGTAGGWLIALAVMIRKGIVPFHSWYPAIFARGPLATALVTTMPQVATYTAVRLLVGHAGGVAMELVFRSLAALVTAVYGAALAMVQRDTRSLIGMLAMSQSAMVMAGLAGTLPTELCGALAIWVSSGLSLTGIGLVVWSLESRAGRIRIDTLQGRYADAPMLAAFFLLFGLASLGFPGTLSFVADDLIISGSLDERLPSGLMVIIATVFAGIAVMRGWFHLFGGPTTVDAPQHAILPRERFALSALVAILFGLGLFPGPFVHSLENVAASLLMARAPHPPVTLPAGDHP